METLAMCAVVAVVGLGGAYVYTKSNRDSSPIITAHKFMSNFEFEINEEMEGYYSAADTTFGKMPCTFYIFRENGEELKLHLEDKQNNIYILKSLYFQMNEIEGSTLDGTIYKVAPKGKKLIGGKRRQTRSGSRKGRKSQRRK